MKILPINQLYTAGARQNFNAVCSVSCVYVGDEYYGYRKHQVLHDAASALAHDMHAGTLPPNVKAKLRKYFPDYVEGGATATTCYRTDSKGRYFPRQNWANVLTGYDAEIYRRCTFPDDTLEERRVKQLDTFERIFRNSGQIKELCLYTKVTENKGKKVLTITDVSLASSIPPVRNGEHTYY